MLIDFIATFAAAFVAAGSVLLVNHMTGRRLPRWLAPVAAGVAMLGYAIWSEYSWFDRTVAPFPDSMVVVSKNESTALWRPWTYVVPFTNRFIAIDTSGIKTNEAAPGQKLVDVFLVGRWINAIKVPVLYDCPGGQRADLVDGAEFGADGTVTNAEWHPVPEGDPVMTAVCAEG